MKRLMAALRRQPPASLGGMQLARLRDYLAQSVARPGAAAQPLAGPKGDLVIFDLAQEGNYVAVRPSGTEPKVKFYLFAFDPPAASADIEAARQRLAERIAAMERDLRAAAAL
jgi:phosphoglucomutase/phosphomannomutase